MSDITPTPGMTVTINVEGSGLPGGGSAGDMLTRTENGAAWKPAPDVEQSVFDMLVKAGLLPMVADADGAILTDENGAILLM